MTGADIVGALLAGDAELVAFVAADRIKLGALPDNVALPALLVRTVSSVERQPLRPGMTTRTTDRVAVTVRATSYRDQVRAIALARAACRGRVGDIGGGMRVSVLTASGGPDVRGPGNSYEQTQDFRVSFDA